MFKQVALNKNDQGMKQPGKQDESIQYSVFNKNYSSKEIQGHRVLPLTQPSEVIQRRVKVGSVEIIDDTSKEVKSTGESDTKDVKMEEIATDEITEDGGLETTTKVSADEWITNKGYNMPQGEKLKKMAGKNRALYIFANEAELKKYVSIESGKAQLKVNFINVGQGSSALVSSRQKGVPKYALIDTGTNSFNVPEFLKLKKDGYFPKEGETSTGKTETKRGIETDRIVTINTHDHADHIGASAGANKVYTAKVTGEEAYREPIGSPPQEQKAKEREKEVFGEIGIKPLLGPDKDEHPKDENDNSLVTYKEMGNEIIIFPGDRGVEDLITILQPLSTATNKFTGKRVIIAASHHGSETGNNKALFELFSNAEQVFIVISAGCDNTYNLPSAKELIEDKEKGEARPDGSHLSTPIKDEMDTDVTTRYAIYNTQNLKDGKGSVVYKSDGSVSAIYSKQILEGKIDRHGSKKKTDILYNEFVQREGFESMIRDLPINTIIQENFEKFIKFYTYYFIADKKGSIDKIAAMQEGLGKRFEEVLDTIKEQLQKIKLEDVAGKISISAFIQKVAALSRTDSTDQFKKILEEFIMEIKDNEGVKQIIAELTDKIPKGGRYFTRRRKLSGGDVVKEYIKEYENDDY